MIFEPFKPFLASAYQIKFATEAWEKNGAAALRRQVFCVEQGLFDGDDRDPIDASAITIVAISLFGVAADAVVGTVRIHQHPEDPGVWWGSRLAVNGQYRRLGAVGTGLIRLAVAAAHARGCHTFLGNIQSRNADLFHRMHWRTLEEVALYGQPHHMMQADLDFYPPFQQPEIGFLSLPEASRMTAVGSLAALAGRLRSSSGIAAKSDIASVAKSLGLSGDDVIPVGDDCAAIPDGDGYLLFAIEGFMNEFVAGDPWFAGWCGAMVNISDIAAMGGRPIAVVNAIWADGEAKAAPVLAGLKEAATAYAVPVIGGHTNVRTDRGQLSVAILGRAKRLLTSFDAEPGDTLIAAIDLRGRYREPFSNWEAATDAPHARLRGDIELLPLIAEAGLSRAAKDISQGGIIGTAAMLAECSGVAIDIDINAIPKPANVVLERWLLTFPSFGYLLSVKPWNAAETIARFTARGIAASAVGAVTQGSRVSIRDGAMTETIWDFAEKPLIGAGRRTRLPMGAVA